jgi:hypothetical protein
VDVLYSDGLSICSDSDSHHSERWSAKFGQADKWNFCLRAARMPRIRSEYDQANPTDPRPVLQGQGGAGRDQGREDAGRTGAAIRCAPNQITAWKAHLVEATSGLFGSGRAASDPAIDMKTLHAKIGELTLENDFLSGALTKAGLLSAKR